MQTEAYYVPSIEIDCSDDVSIFVDNSREVACVFLGAKLHGSLGSNGVKPLNSPVCGTMESMYVVADLEQMMKSRWSICLHIIRQEACIWLGHYLRKLVKSSIPLAYFCDMLRSTPSLLQDEYLSCPVNLASNIQLRCPGPCALNS